jgi:hypothetical protein
MTEQLDKFTDTAKPMVEAIKDRMRVTFFRSLALTWCLWNWKFIAVLIAGSEAMTERVNHLSDQYLSWTTSLLFPVLAALLLPALGEVATVASTWCQFHMAKWRLAMEERRAQQEHEQDRRHKQRAADLKFVGSPEEMVLRSQLHSTIDELQLTKTQCAKYLEQLREASDERDVLKRAIEARQLAISALRGWLAAFRKLSKDEQVKSLSQESKSLDRELQIAEGDFFEAMHKALE